ncbi:MAG TPA: DUF371 domain-containing protein [Thermoleophilaceae bacterium]
MAAVGGSASGHASVRATHAKTLELVREADVGERATCVVAVAARLDEEALRALRGRVELTIAAGGRSESVRGRMNPAFRPGDPLVVRRAGAVARNAVVIEADRAAADLDRGLVERLAAAGEAVRVTFAEVPGAAPGTLVVEPGRGAAGRGGPPARAGAAAGCLAVASPLEAADVDRALAALDAGGRVALRRGPGDDALAAELVASAHDRGHDVLPAAGLDPIDSVLAVLGAAAAGHEELDARSARPRDLAAAGAGCVVVAGLPADRAARWLRQAERAGAARAAIGLDLGTPREQYLAWRPGGDLAIPGARGRTATVAIVLDR